VTATTTANSILKGNNQPAVATTLAKATTATSVMKGPQSAGEAR